MRLIHHIVNGGELSKVAKTRATLAGKIQNKNSSKNKYEHLKRLMRK